MREHITARLARRSVPSGVVARAGPLVCATLALALVAMIASTASGGPLEPGGPPASTSKPLTELPPAWHQSLSASGADPCNTERFTCVMGGTAVFDAETGLVWERTPNTSAGAVTWAGAVGICAQRVGGNRFGWRLPTASELLSLIDATQESPALPAGSPFDLTTIPTASFWTSTKDLSSLTIPRAWYVNLELGEPSSTRTDFGIHFRHWCVRASDPGSY